MGLLHLLSIAIGGALGAVARFGVVRASAHLFGASFPIGTLFVNVVGSFLMGVLIIVLTARLNLSSPMRDMILVGGLGSFTTFSTFSLDVVNLFERGAQLTAFGYIAASVIFSIGALLLGMSLAKSIF